MTKQDIIEQVLDIRDGGRVNMCDISGVERVAMDMGYYSLVLWIEDHKKICWNDSIMIRASYAINAAPGKVDVAVKADKLNSSKNISLTGDVSGMNSTDLSGNITIPTVLTNAGTAGTYIKVTTDAQGRVVSGAQLTVDDVPDLPLTKITGIGTAAVKNVSLGADQIPTLDANGKLPSSVLPPLNVSTAAPFRLIPFVN